MSDKELTELEELEVQVNRIDKNIEVMEQKIRNLGIGNTAKILNQNKIVADYAELLKKIEALEKKLFENSGEKSFPEHILISRELFNRFKAWCWEHDRGLYEELKEVETQ